MSAPARIAGLDGVRGVAIALVVLFHMNWLACGWIGVQLFFVLSGFLITRILLASRERPLGEYLRTFYGRRALRIFPLYYLYLAVALIVIGAGWSATVQGRLVFAQAPWAASYLLNWDAMRADYSPSFFLSHFWSLAIEEQFYLIWPLLLFALPRRALAPALVALMLAGPILRWLVASLLHLPADRVASAVGVCTLSQLDAFAMGALVCLLPAAPRRSGALLAVAAPVAWLAGALWSGWGVAPTQLYGAPLALGYPNTLAAHDQFLWGYSAIDALAALLVWAVVSRGWGVSMLEWRPLAWLGRVSYGVYVLHFPLAHLLSPLVFRIHDATGAGIYASLALWSLPYLALLLGLAAASYHFYERRFLAAKGRIFPS
jgi:peptidoglycan/LPS O-acetylase OafA/YrhL